MPVRATDHLRAFGRDALMWCLLLWIHGCGRTPGPQAALPSPPIVKIACDMDGRAESTDGSVGMPLRTAMRMTDHTSKVTSISTAHGCDVYVAGGGDISAPDLLATVKAAADTARPELPISATISDVILLPAGQTIPIMHPKLVDEVSMIIDREKAAQRSVRVAAIDAALMAAALPKDEPAAQRLQHAAAVHVTAEDGTQVPLTDIATLEVVKTPDVVVREMP